MQQHRQRSASFAIAGPDSLPQKRYYYVVVAQDESIAMLFHAHAARGGGSPRLGIHSDGSGRSDCMAKIVRICAFRNACINRSKEESIRENNLIVNPANDVRKKT